VSDTLKTFSLIARQVSGLPRPSVTQISRTKDPYAILVSCIVSLRTKDKTTREASERLFARADTPRKMLRLSPGAIERLIYPAGFYRRKAHTILEASRRIVRDFKGVVPRQRRELLSIKGVGSKTATLVLGLGFGIPAICVDTHVHRISNRLGWVTTAGPEDTEEALMKIFPKRMWIGLNTVLVSFGQQICLPVSPLCSACRLEKLCPKQGVGRRR